jgi:leucyl/phenylalanyl-tRNA--protein transferase
MPVFELPEENIFPPPHLAEKNGLLAVGGDLSVSRLLTAYSMGIFPWFSEGDPILWWSPDPRLVLFPEELRVSRSLKQVLRKDIFQFTFDRAFEDVISACASVHKRADGDTWITGDMIEAYIRLHEEGYAHSVECWHEDDLVGGLYGISMGSAFFGESMFTKKSNASKAALVTLVRQLQEWNFRIIDCQVTTRHLMSFGAREIPRSEFLRIISDAIREETAPGLWS